MRKITDKLYQIIWSSKLQRNCLEGLKPHFFLWTQCKAAMRSLKKINHDKVCVMDVVNKEDNCKIFTVVSFLTESI